MCVLKMKLTSVGAFICIFMLCSQYKVEADDDSEPINFVELRDKCMAESGLTDFAIIEEFQNNGALTDEDAREPKCYTRCMFEVGKFGLTEANSIDAFRVGIFLSGYRGEAAMTQPVVSEIATNCLSSTDDPDKCQRAYNLKKCIMQEQIKYYGPGVYRQY